MSQGVEVARVRTWSWCLLLSGCVVSVDQRITIDEPVELVRVHLAHGDVTLTGRPGDVTLEGAIGGPTRAPAFVVEDGVLTVDVTCALCGGSLDLEVPPETRAVVAVDAGSATIEGLAADLDVAVDLGDASVADHGGGAVVARARTGAIDLDLAAFEEVTVEVENGDAILALPAGGYALDLTGGSPSVEDGITDDPAGPPVVVDVARGDLTLEVR